jgi:bacterioferritin (cytochrome b1)
VTEDIWRAVLAETEEHIGFLQRELSSLAQMGEECYLMGWR